MMESVGVSAMLSGPEYIDINTTYILMAGGNFFIIRAPSISEAYKVAHDYCYEEYPGYVIRPLSSMVWMEIDFAKPNLTEVTE